MALLDVFKKEKNPKSPTKAGEQTEGSISADVVPFLNIIAKNSLALPGMARDMNVLRQNIVKLVKIKNAEAITKADKFFKTEDQREAELEAARKQEATPKQEREGRPRKEKMEKGGEEGILSVLWDALKSILGGLFLGLGLAFAKVFDLGKIVSSIVDKLNPMPLIEGLFKTLKEGWKQITETDIVKETLIKGFGKFLDFITAGLFGEKELRQSLDDLKTYLTPMMDVLGETFDKVVAWLKDNVGWDSFTIPLSKATNLIPDEIKKYLPAISLPDITVPGFRPFKNAGKKKEQPSGEGSAGGAAPPTPATDATTAAAATATTPEAMMPVSAKTSDLGVPTFPATGDKTKDSAIQDFFGGGKAALGSGDPSAMFANMMALKEKYKDVSSAGASTGTGATVRDPADNFKSVSPTPSRAAEPPAVAAPTPAPTAPAATAEELQAQIEKKKKLKKDFREQSDQFIKRFKDPSSRNYNPEKAKELEKDAKETEKSYDVEIEAMEKELANLKKGSKGGSKGSPSAPSASPSMSASLAPASSGSAGGSPSMGGMSGGGAAPTTAAASPTTSGASISTASSEVAEGQRMDSAASAGVYVDAGTVNSGSTTTGKQPKQTASAYNSDFIKSYAT